MARVRIDFATMLLFEDEEAGDTHVALYATVVDSHGTTLGQFQWNNLGTKVNEGPTPFNLGIDPANPNVIDFDLNTWATITVHGYADDDNDWPTDSSHENDLGGASVVFDPSVPATLGSLVLGPTTTDNGNAGFSVNVVASLIGGPTPGAIRLILETVTLYEDEEAGDTHMALYVFQDAGTEIFRWNNGGSKVNEVNTYALDSGTPSPVVTLNVTGPTLIWVDGYADDDSDWPDASSHENSLGRAVITVDPSDPTTFGQRQLGPTQTDNGNQGYTVNLSVELLPPGSQADLAITGIEVTQAIQHFRSALGPDNSLPLVANRSTLIRAYLDSGGPQVPNVTGTATVTGPPPAQTFQIAPLQSMTAKPDAMVNPLALEDTLNFLLPAEQASGELEIVVQAVGGGSTSNPASVAVRFTPTLPRDIIIVRVQNGATGDLVSRPAYIDAVNLMTRVYPIADNPGMSIRFHLIPGEVMVSTKNLDDLLDDLEDLQEDEGNDDHKLYGMLAHTACGGSSRKWDNVADGDPEWSTIAHEVGHLYGLDHAPCENPVSPPDDVDDDFTPKDGTPGGAGIDVTTSPPVLVQQAEDQARAALMQAPAAITDIMTYCFTCGNTTYDIQWISGYHWQKLFDAFR